jgi:hypothetical protein
LIVLTEEKMTRMPLGVMSISEAPGFMIEPKKSCILVLVGTIETSEENRGGPGSANIRYQGHNQGNPTQGQHLEARFPLALVGSTVPLEASSSSG